MPVTAPDRVSAETTDREAPIGLWTHPGLSPVERWGSPGHRAGSMNAGSVALVLAEAIGTGPEFTRFFTADDATSRSPGTPLAASLQAAHRGTRMVHVRGPEGRLHVLETPA